MDFLVTPRHRWVYVALFFVMAASLFNAYKSLESLVNESPIFNIESVYLNILYNISKYKLVSLGNQCFTLSFFSSLGHDDILLWSTDPTELGTNFRGSY